MKLTDSMLTAGNRALALRVFDQLAARVSLPAPPLVAIHADLTPTNIIVGTDGRVTILDFAMAKSGAPATTMSLTCFSTSTGSRGAD